MSSKREVSTSEDSSDEELQVKKKQKKSKSSQPEKPQTIFPISKKRQVSVREFKGKIFVDIREYYEADDGELKPGKKGISLMVDQWNKLKEQMDAIDEAVQSIS